MSPCILEQIENSRNLAIQVFKDSTGFGQMLKSFLHLMDSYNIHVVTCNTKYDTVGKTLGNYPNWDVL